MSVTEVLAELKHEHFQKSPSWGSGKVFVARDNQFIDVSSLSTGLSPDQQQAFVKKIDDILLGQADREKTLPRELTEVQKSMQESMQASLSKMVITPQEALCWFKRASSNINTVTPWMSKERQETESIRQGVDAFAAYTKVSSMMATYSAADKHLIDSLRQNMEKFQHTWTDERAATFKRSVLQASWLRITAERIQKERYDLLERNLGLSWFELGLLGISCF